MILTLYCHKKMTEIPERMISVIYILSYLLSFFGSAFLGAAALGAAADFFLRGAVESIFDFGFFATTGFAFFTAFTVLPSVFAKRLWKRSTVPALSTSFCFPVKKGWQCEQISSLITGFVERVLKV